MSSIFFIEEAFQHFWRQHPALLYALMLLLGIEVALHWTPILLLPLSLLILPLIRTKEGAMRLLLGIGLFFLGIILLHLSHQLPSPLLEEEIQGTAHIEITSLSSQTSPFGKQWTYRGTIRHFQRKDHLPFVGHHFPFTVSVPQNEETRRPLANQDYRIEGKLRMTPAGRYALKVNKHTPWYPIEGSWSAAEWRFHAKQRVQQYIEEKIADPRAASFLSGIAIGDFDDRLLQLDFSRFGLQHILAISGFHFSIIAAILSLLLRLIIKDPFSHLLLLLLLTSYFIFLGCAPSIMRAWITIVIAISGVLCGQRAFALNSLGIAILVILLYDPFLADHLGFQLSCITTAAILLLYSASDQAMQEIMTKRRLSEMIQMNSLNQHAYCFLTFFRRAFALTIAVNLIAIPTMFFYFHKFPVLSLLYNLFFPFMVSISMLLLILGLIASLLPPLAACIHLINSIYTRFTLDFTRNLPLHLDLYWNVSLSIEWLLAYLCVIFSAAILWKHQQRTAWQQLAWI